MTFNEFVREACPPLELAWRKYRRKAARHRLEVRMSQLGIGSYGDYLGLLRRDPAEAAKLPDVMLVTVTRFFREQKVWLELAEKVIPGMLDSKAPSHGKALRAWSAGCCGGEEPYSLAMCWLNYLQRDYPEWKMEIIATDIDLPSLARARRATYQLQSLREVPSGIRDLWFHRTDSTWSVRAEVRSLVSFERSNLLSDPPPRDLDLVLCRYLAFTYYQGERLMAALRILHESLRPGGWLMIGGKESLPAAARDLFEPMEGSRIFWRRIG